MAQAIVELDVRPILRDGGEPFAKIMEAVSSLAPDQGLRLYATFKPAPLFQVLGAKGYSHEAREIGDGDWEVVFRPNETAGASGSAADVPAAASDTRDWPEPAQEMDNRDLEPPEPMVRVLAALENMNPGEVLAALLRREPMFLFPQLAKRGHVWRGAFEPGGATYKILIRVGVPPSPAA